MMTDIETAQHTLKRGLQYPYDAPDEWWEGDGRVPPDPVDWAHAAARGVLADLNDRGGIKHGFANLDEDIRKDIVESLAAVIRCAKKPHPA